ncbi:MULTISPECIES: MBL fold metallo-hydrolase [Chitinophagaceae]
MNRRSLLKNSLLAGLGASLSLNTSKASFGKPAIDKKGGFRNIELGELALTILTDGHISQKPIQPFMCPLASQKDVDKILMDHFRSTEYVDLAMNVLLVKKDNKNILLDAGMGIFSDGGDNNFLLQSLTQAGIQPEDITEILISHAHPDHIGGVVSNNNALVFPNADIYISKVEHDFWQKATIKDFSRSELRKDPKFLELFIPKVRNIFSAIQPKLKFYDLGSALFDTFSFQLIPGHTPGMVMITLESKGEKLSYIADLIHHDLLLFQHPEWGFSGDTDLELATQTRRKTLLDLSDSKSKIFAYHLPWPGVGYTVKDGNAYKWIPEVFATV